jgi:hypothetical protein
VGQGLRLRGGEGERRSPGAAGEFGRPAPPGCLLSNLEISKSPFPSLSQAPYADGIVDPDRPKNLPLEPPTFTLSTIKNAIPAHCFKRNLYTGLKHLASDVLIIALLGYAATFLLQPTKWGLPSWAGYVAWPLYWYAQGAVMTGVWVIAHECGHQSFSEVINPILLYYHGLKKTTLYTILGNKP